MGFLSGFLIFIEITEKNINNISEANAIVESWRDYIISYKSLAVESIVKNLKIPKRQLKDFKVIEQNLKIIESNFIGSY